MAAWPHRHCPTSRTAPSGRLSLVRSHHCCFCHRFHRFQSTFTPSLSFTPEDSSARWQGQGLAAVAQPPREQKGRRGPETWVDLPKVTQPGCGQAGAGPMRHNPYPAPSTVSCPPPHSGGAGLGDREGQGEKQLWLRACPAVEVSCDLAAMAELAGTICSHSAEMWTGQAWWLTSSAVQAPGKG